MRGKKGFIKFILLISITLLVGCSSAGGISAPLTEEQKIEDFEYMYEVIKESYPYLEVNKRVNGIDWIVNKEDYLELIKKTENDEEFIRVMSNILSELNNGHTHLLDINTFGFYKENYGNAGWYNFFNDKKVSARYKVNEKESENSSNNLFSNEALILNDIVENSVGYIYLPQMFGEEQMEVDMEYIKEYLYTIKDYKALVIDIRGNSGGSDWYWYTLLSYILPEEHVKSGYILFRDSEIINNYLKKRYINGTDIDKLPESIDKNAPEEVRIAFNSFIESNVIIKPDEDSINFDGNIYLLIDNSVYSSSETFAIFCKEEGIATLIGERTSGDGGGIDPVLFKLENSGLIVRMSSNMYLTKSGICDEEFKTEPDYNIEYPKRMNDTKYDFCIKKVLELEKINNDD